jgi:hypothetical protein
MNSRARIAAIAGAALLGAAAIGTAAWATIPDSSGVIHGCFNASGQLRVIDSATDACRSAESALDCGGRRRDFSPKG